VKRAVVLLKTSPHYRRESFEAGMKALGYRIVHRIDDPKPGDALVTWNLTGGLEREAQRFTKAGAAVLVSENGYLSPPGIPGLYAVSKGGHNGAGTFPTSTDPARWLQLGVELKRWRQDGKHILVCGQRGIGSRDMASPHAWHQKAAERIRTMTKRPVKIRPHPGQDGRGTPLSHDLKNAWAVVIWSSAAGVHSLVQGIPVFYAAPHWICEKAALPFAAFGKYIESPLCDDAIRQAAMVHMAHGQWAYKEIATGEPLKGVIEC
jgi:hypothetical protein